MSAPKHRFNRRLTAAMLGLGLLLPGALYANEVDFSKQESGLYSDVFNENIYYEFVDYLNFANLYRKVTGKKVTAQNINVYDEVPDSTFFTNRHSRKRLSADALARGPLEKGDEPDLSGDLTVISGKSEGLHPGFFARDAKGDVYLFKFDPPDNLELATSAEIIGSRFYHAAGYNTSASSIAMIDPAQFVPSETATFYDRTGFKKPLTRESLDELLLFIPYTEDGKLRASAIKFLEGDIKGPFGFRDRRRNDPQDLIPHEHRREIRALKIFSSWINNYDVRRSNTMQTQTVEEGAATLKNYVMDYNASLGAGTHEPKPPMFSYEHMLDYGEAAKAFFALGLWEKPWQKKWQDAGEQTGPPAIGYFDNRFFDPATFKTQLPSRAFKNLTNADAFWAAKILMTFSDEDVRALVSAAQYSRKEDADRLTQTLIERRDLIGRHWFSQVNPLDEFDVSGGKLVFTDLSVKYGFEKASDALYQAEVYGGEGKKYAWITSLENKESALPLDSSWLDHNAKVQVILRTVRQGLKPGPAVTVTIGREGILSIVHQD